jgi:hypothetical protein
LLFELLQDSVPGTGTDPLFRLKERKTPTEVGLIALSANSVYESRTL